MSKRKLEESFDGHVDDAKPPAKRVRFNEDANTTRELTDNNDHKQNGIGPIDSQNKIILIDAYGHSDKGKKPHMEDKLFISTDLSKLSNNEYFAKSQNNQSELAKNRKNALFIVLDGHGGSQIASYLQFNLKDLIISKLIQYNNKNNNNQTSNEINTSPSNTNKNNNNSTTTSSKITNIQKALHASFKIVDQRV